MKATDSQVGGTHYKGFKIQPVEYIQANDLDFLQGNVVKYITRHKFKNGKVDIEKAIHFCQLILELQYSETKNEVGEVGNQQREGIRASIQSPRAKGQHLADLLQNYTKES